MAKTFVQMQDSILGQIGDLHPSTRDKVKRWINDSRNEIWERLPGAYKEVTDYFRTSTSYTTGTVSVAADGTSVTGVGTSWDTTWTRRWIQIGGTQPWYEIASFESTTGCTLADAALAAASGATYVIKTYMWPIAANVQQLLQVSLESDERISPLEMVNRTDMLGEIARPLEWDDGIPAVCWLDEKNSAGNYQLAVWPTPSSVTLVRYRYEKDLTELVDDSDTMEIPGGDAAIQDLTMVQAFTFAGKPQRAAFFDARSERSFDRLLQTVPRDRGRSWVRKDRTDAGRSTGTPVNMGSMWPRGRR